MRIVSLKVVVKVQFQSESNTVITKLTRQQCMVVVISSPEFQVYPENLCDAFFFSMALF